MSDVIETQLPTSVRNHWWWRPGWREGRHFYACHLILDDQPELRALIAKYQAATKALPMLDPIPAQWLHVTVQGIGFVDEISPDELDAVSQGIADELAQIERPTVTFERPTIRPEAIVLLAHPAEPLYEVRQRIHRAAVAVLGDERVDPLPKPEDYMPHVSTAYVNSDASAAPIVAALEGVEVEPVTVTFLRADLLEFHRDHRMYEWTRATHVPFMFKWWNVVQDNKRRQWTLEPFTSVGPLDFGMSPGEVSEALSDVTKETQRHTSFRGPRDTKWTIAEGEYKKFGLSLYYREERLAGIVVNALRGPQVLVDDVALVGQVPSVLEQWMVDRAATREPYTELGYMSAGVPVSESLGVVIDVQRVDDHLITRPVFVPHEAMDDLPHWLPDEMWSRY